ncbi:MAG: protein-glutamate O-methyltransferase CheR [Desulfobacterales bacterium]|nr:protein-glutamate O-methyltransferase CheR [Desulfobacterales bacterium]
MTPITPDQNLEIQLLLEAVHRKYGYNFKEYADKHTQRRLQHRLYMDGFDNFSQMIHRVIHDRDFFTTLLTDLSINVTEMFRDPTFFQQIRRDIIPLLQTYAYVKIWHAGCSTGQEAYSMSILLEEAGMKQRSQIYATDFNEVVLRRAREAIYPLDVMKTYTTNYQLAGGSREFSDYYTADYDHAILKKVLREKVVFSAHNLVTDTVFGEMNLIFCRNVLIYFNTELKNRVLQLFSDSLCPGGYLCLGSRETLKFSQVADQFETLSETHRIYRKKRSA